MPSLLASVSRKCASLLKSITLCEGVRDNGRDCGQTVVIEQVQIRSLKSGGGLTRGRGMIEIVRQQWLYSTQACAAIHDAMTSLAGKHHITTYSACGVWRGKASA